MASSYTKGHLDCVLGEISSLKGKNGQAIEQDPQGSGVITVPGRAQKTCRSGALEILFSVGLGSPGLIVGLDDLSHIFEP